MSPGPGSQEPMYVLSTTYDTGTGTSDKASSPYISEMKKIVRKATAELRPAYDRAIRRGEKPAIVLDADDTTLWTYDMEVADMDFNFNPAEQNMWVQDQRFPATPSMVTLVTAAEKAGCTVVGLTGRNADQKAATIGNLAKVANLGDQFSDLKGGNADRAIKLPNPTYYFP